MEMKAAQTLMHPENTRKTEPPREEIKLMNWECGSDPRQF
jgi:hypothetical protein